VRTGTIALVTPRVQRPHRNLKVGGHLGWLCQTSRPGRCLSRLVPCTSRHRDDEGSPLQ
jgi:hypothetical protein